MQTGSEWTGLARTTTTQGRSHGLQKADGREAAEWRLLRTGDSRPGILHSLHCAGTGTALGTGTGNPVSSKQAIGVIDKYCQVIIAALLCVAVEWVVSLLLREKKNQHNRPRAAGGRCKRSECVGAGRELPGSYAVKTYRYKATQHDCTTSQVPCSTRLRGAISCSREEGWKKACFRCCCCCCPCWSAVTA
ncbi:hypothetical protein CABS01_00362 [Colletotrichum abscissum]|uniref:uncharacterized protein n=1 Tax=Colletotrichum abscissum TaxID=1671311 RepID=UPI0027D5233E|nr:uncharacterized protein CABS01_00362 [Colletotrichum abscissum]KAK1525273.1 hypothetical protein CABS01_00362 [Colletotrichum abscissum]